MYVNVFLICVCVVCCIDTRVLAIGTKYPRKYTDCDHVKATQLSEGEKPQSNLYEVFLNGSKPLKVNCRFEVNATYTSIMQQKSGTVSFVRGYNDYLLGFGAPASGDFWMGLRSMYTFTAAGHHVLTVTLQDWYHNIKTLKYTHFYLGPEYDRFRLSIGGYLSGAILPDDFGHNNGMQFATHDYPDPKGCANLMSAGWWYNYCTFTLPTGKYYPGGPYTPPPGQYYDGIYYHDWLGSNYSLKYIRLEVSTS